mmetsp:Transcript_65340/g.170039  ORF Transcript_65340/g.170039 Transcript_65340/m.170039 type:complete len:241 (-) Transcript_65340:722-1444(-)
MQHHRLHGLGRRSPIADWLLLLLRDEAHFDPAVVCCAPGHVRLVVHLGLDQPKLQDDVHHYSTRQQTTHKPECRSHEHQVEPVVPRHLREGGLELRGGAVAAHEAQRHGGPEVAGDREPRGEEEPRGEQGGDPHAVLARHAERHLRGARQPDLLDGGHLCANEHRPEDDDVAHVGDVSPTRHEEVLHPRACAWARYIHALLEYEAKHARHEADGHVDLAEGGNFYTQELASTKQHTKETK